MGQEGEGTEGGDGKKGREREEGREGRGRMARERVGRPGTFFHFKHCVFTSDINSRESYKSVNN